MLNIVALCLIACIGGAVHAVRVYQGLSGTEVPGAQVSLQYIDSIDRLKKVALLDGLKDLEAFKEAATPITICRALAFYDGKPAKVVVAGEDINLIMLELNTIPDLFDAIEFMLLSVARREVLDLIKYGVQALYRVASDGYSSRNPIYGSRSIHIALGDSLVNHQSYLDLAGQLVEFATIGMFPGIKQINFEGSIDPDPPTSYDLDEIMSFAYVGGKATVIVSWAVTF